MKPIFIILVSLFSFAAFAGGNVALFSSASNVKFQNKANNHSDYYELEIRGKTTQSDAVVSGLPKDLPQTIRLLFKNFSSLDKITFESCFAIALKAKETKKFIRIDIFMSNPGKLVSKIEGGMADTSFNQFVIKSDDSDFASIGCELN